MKNTFKLCSLCILFLILTLVFRKDSYAITYFFDDFSSGNLEKWNQNIGNVGDTSSWFVLDGLLHSKVNKGKYSYLYAKLINSSSDYSFIASTKNISGVDQQYVFRVTEDGKEYYLVDYRYNDPLWYWDNNNIKVYRIYSNGYKLLGTYPSIQIPRSFDITQGVFHEVKITIEGNNIKAYFDNNLAVNVGDTDIPLNGNGVGMMTWGGDYKFASENVYRSVEILNDKIRNKIIILPGLGASWNAGAILLGDTSPSYQWTMTPFVKNYDLLISALETNGLVKNQDFYVWNYDWRKPLNQIVNDFNNFVVSLGLETGEKIDLVGHSLGGLTARVWTQDNPDLVNKTITLGSPHFGSVKAYEAWNGVKISDSVDVASIALNVLLQMQRKNNDTSVQTLRSYAPIVFDLSPTFSFLKRNGSAVTTKSSQYLNDKNSAVSLINSKLTTVDGIGETTKETIILGDRSLFDKVLGVWEEGRPLSYINGVGDGTVLKKSALISGSENLEFISAHGALVDKSVNAILQKLDLGTTVNISINYLDKQAVFYLGSPATMTVNCGGTERNEVDNWVVMENQEIKNCQVKLLGKDGGGTYHLVVGDSNDWKYIEGEIADNEEQNLVINGVDVYWLVLENNFANLGATGAMVATRQKDINKTIDEYIKFRVATKNFKYSEEILENLKFILNTKSVTSLEINNMYLKAKASKSLVDTNLRLMARKNLTPSYSSALTYEQANNLMNFGKNYAANYLANKLFGVVWK